MAGVELGMRIATVSNNNKPLASNPPALAKYLMPRLQLSKQEKFIVILLNSRNYVIGNKVISNGTLNNTIIHPREVFAPAIINNAAAIAFAHNHPSGEPAPSQEDMELTHTIMDAGEIMGIPVIGHIIIGQGCYFSFVENDCKNAKSSE